MTAQWLPPGKQTFIDENGAPLVRGFVYHYIPGTDTFKDTWIDADQSATNTNPVELDARGQAVIWGDGFYRQRVTDVDGNEIWDRETGFDPDFLDDYALKDLSNVTGADFGAKEFVATNGVADADLADRFGHIQNVTDDYGAVANGAMDNSVGLQQALTFARVNNRRLKIPGANAAYNFSTSLAIENVVYTDGGMIVEGDGWGAPSQNNGSTLRYTGAGAAAITMTGISSGGNQDGGVEFRTFGLVGATTFSGNVAGADGFSAERVSQASFHDVMSSYSGANGMHLKFCYSSGIYRGSFFSNFEAGISYENSANRVAIQDVSAFKNGRSKRNADQANVRLFGTVALAPRISGTDVSYSGRGLFTWAGGGETIAAITSYNVAASVATVVTASAHTLTTGDRITVTNATSATVWDAKFGRIVTVVNPTTFTFPTGAANGAYTAITDPALIIGTYSAGLLLGNAYGALIEAHYCEVPQGPSVYVGAPCRGVTFLGGYNQDAWLAFDQARNALVAGMVFVGYGGLSTVEGDERPTIDVHESNIFLNGAQWEHGPYFMKNGNRYGPAIPTTGNWELGDVLWNSAPAVGSPMGWQCVAAGTPGTWGTMPNLV